MADFSVDSLTAQFRLLCTEGANIAPAIIAASDAIPRKHVCGRLRQALLQAGSGVADRPAWVLTLLRAVTSVPAEARRLAQQGVGAKRVKQVKATATTSLVSALKTLPASECLPLATLVEGAPAWLAMELLNPPSAVQLERDAVALEALVRSVCHVQAWGSDFRSALRCLRHLRPGEAASPSEREAFERLSAAFIDSTVAALGAGNSLHCSARDSSTIIAEIAEEFGEDAASRMDRFADALSCISEAHLDTASEARLAEIGNLPFLELPSDVQIMWVDGIDAWVEAEARIAAADTLAVDTEWWKVGAGPALVQIAVNDPPVCFLVDTDASVPAIVSGLQRLFEDQRLRRLGWSFKGDAQRFQELCQCSSSFDVVDLQPICQTLMGVKSTPSLDSACRFLLGRPLNKTEQCSDWRRRPLTDAQTRYAALDALVLLQMMDELTRRGTTDGACHCSAAL